MEANLSAHQKVKKYIYISHTVFIYSHTHTHTHTHAMRYHLATKKNEILSLATRGMKLESIRSSETKESLIMWNLKNKQIYNKKETNPQM